MHYLQRVRIAEHAHKFLDNFQAANSSVSRLRVHCA